MTSNIFLDDMPSKTTAFQNLPLRKPHPRTITGDFFKSSVLSTKSNEDEIQHDSSMYLSCRTNTTHHFHQAFATNTTPLHIIDYNLNPHPTAPPLQLVRWFQSSSFSTAELSPVDSHKRSFADFFPVVSEDDDTLQDHDAAQPQPENDVPPDMSPNLSDHESPVRRHSPFKIRKLRTAQHPTYSQHHHK